MKQPRPKNRRGTQRWKMTMTSTTIATPKFAEGVPYSESTRLVAAAHPGLIEAMEKASEEFYRHEDA